MSFRIDKPVVLRLETDCIEDGACRNDPSSDAGHAGPCPRMNAQLVVRNGILYVYGGTYEQGDKQITLRDLYKLNLHKLDEWQTLIQDDSENMVRMEVVVEVGWRWSGMCGELRCGYFS